MYSRQGVHHATSRERSRKYHVDLVKQYLESSFSLAGSIPQCDVRKAYRPRYTLARA